MIHNVDLYYVSNPKAQVIVYEDYDIILNQTNISENNNKFYIIQLLESKIDSDCNYEIFTRWGRVVRFSLKLLFDYLFLNKGEIGQQLVLGPYQDVKIAIKEFEKKFKNKTSNNWAQRDSFISRAGKYTLMDVVETGKGEQAISLADKVVFINKKIIIS